MLNTTGSTVLLWLRPDLDRKTGRAYWAGPHAQLVARTPGFLEYRQHHFTATSSGLYPAADGVETSIPEQRRIDGIAEVTFPHLWSPLLGRRQGTKVQQDERNVFARTVLNTTPPRGTRWIKSDGEPVGARTVVLLRRRPGVGKRDFGSFVHNVFGPALARPDGTTELRAQTFMPFAESMWKSPDVAHDNPENQQFHAAVVVGVADRDSLAGVLASAPVAGVASDLATHCAAAHAYEVEATYVYTDDGRPTLPRSGPERKPRLDPAKREVPAAPARAAQERSDTPFPSARRIPVSGHPEDVVVDPEGRALGGVEGGRIVRIDPASGHEETVADTGGRPLGLELLEDGRLIVCDAHRGLLRADLATGEIETLVRFVENVPLRFCSNATAAPDGTIWFTESTSRYDFEQYFGALLEHRPSGRLMRRDPDGTVEVVVAELHFANGLTLTEDGSAVIFAETGAARISRLAVTGTRAGEVEVIADNLPGYPDNLSRAVDGRFWVAMPNPRDAALDKLGTAPGLLRKAVWRIPDRLRPTGKRTVWAMAFDESGNVLADLQEPREDFHMATGVAHHGNQLYLASPEEQALLVLNLGEDT